MVVLSHVRMAQSLPAIEQAENIYRKTKGVIMKIIKPKHEILSITPNVLELIEFAYRNCYKSENKIEPGSAEKLIRNCMNHASPLEHASATVRIICDRGVMAELTRHRLCSFSIESTRFCNYSNDKFGNQITVILPIGFDERLCKSEYNIDSLISDPLRDDIDGTEQISWLDACIDAEYYYFQMIGRGAKPEIARSVLPNSLKTEIVMTCNLREWKWIFRQRCQKAAHPQIREIMLPLLKELHDKIPVVFDEEFEMFFGGY